MEEYFGNGLYAWLEVFRRETEFNPSFVRLVPVPQNRLEIAAGAVRINRLFFDKNNQFKFALGDSGTRDFVKPGIWFGLRYCGNFGFGKRTHSRPWKTGCHGRTRPSRRSRCRSTPLS